MARKRKEDQSSINNYFPKRQKTDIDDQKTEIVNEGSEFQNQSEDTKQVGIENNQNILLVQPIDSKESNDDSFIEDHFSDDPDLDIVTESKGLQQQVDNTNFLPNNIVSIPLFTRQREIKARTEVELNDYKSLKFCELMFRSLGDGYVMDQHERRLSHLIMGKPEWPAVVDHRDGNTLNNKRSNLRIIDRGPNNQNRPKMAGTSSRYIGVSWNNTAKKWHVKTQCQHKSKYLGLYSEEIEAARQHDKFVLAFYKHDPQTNTKPYPDENILSPEEVIIAKQSDPQQYLLTRKPRQLPKYIVKNGSGFQFQHRDEDRKKITKTFRTLPECEIALLKEQIRVTTVKAQRKSALPIQRSVIDDAAIICTNLTRGDSEEIKVPDEAWHYLQQFSWNYHKGEVSGRVNGKTTSFHKAAWQYLHPDEDIPPHLSIDHVKGEPLDIRNLRLATRPQQAQNTKAYGVSGFKGVTPTKSGKWKTQIKVNKKTICLGTHESKEEAYWAYLQAANQHYPGSRYDEEYYIQLQARSCA